MPRYLALYMGSQDSEQQRQWNLLDSSQRAERTERAMSAWGDWVQRNEAVIRDVGAPLGKTLLADKDGISPTSNGIAAYVIVEAASHEAAARLFENHPHFTLFPGTGVEILACLPMPGA